MAATRRGAAGSRDWAKRVATSSPVAVWGSMRTESLLQTSAIMDLAAASLVAREAGATVVGLRGAPPSEAMTVAGPEPSVRELVALLESLDADRDDA